jgi:hypothetical protein
MKVKEQMLNLPDDIHLNKAGGGSSALQIVPLDGLWVCICKNNEPNYATISTTKSGSIKELTSLLIHNSKFSKWDYWKRKGYRCIKVNINFSEANNVK